jgi:hypothetical protein
MCSDSLPQEVKLKIFRGIAIILTQLPMLLFIAGQHDLLFGLNRTHEAFTLLTLLFVLAPLVNLVWVVIEFRRSVKLSRAHAQGLSFLWPLVAVFFFLQSFAVDFFILGHMKM